MPLKIHCLLVGPLRLRRWRGLPLPTAVSTVAPELSLARFAACWLLAVLLFFTAAATKLPSYWLPATPAAALLIALVSQLPWRPLAPAPSPAGAGPEMAAAAGLAVGAAGRDPARAAASGGAPVVALEPGDVGPATSSLLPPDGAFRLAWRLSLVLAAVLTAAFAAAPLWVPLIFDPEMPTLPAELLASGFLARAAWLWGLAALLGWMLRARPAPLRLLALQLPLVLFVPAALLPSWALGDRLRGLPVRQMAAAATRLAAPREPLAMVGILKPSLHYYSRRVVLYEGNEPTDLANLADRLQRERRRGQEPSTARQQPTVLVVIDARTAALPHWQGLAPIPLAQAGLYRLWRLDRSALERRAAQLAQSGIRPRWQEPRPERY